jgi:death-on-curing protein
VQLDAVVFLEVEDVHEAHAHALQFGGGAHGVRDIGMIASAAAAPRNGYYNTLGALAAAYVHGVAKNHGYVDGNKRTAANVLMMFLGANGFPVVLAAEWVAIIEGVAIGTTTQHQLMDLIVAQLLGGVDVAVAT